MKQKILFVLLLGFLLSAVSPVQAQCPMCRISAESNLKAGGTAGKGLNKGILYLFFTPYIIIGSLGYLWWKNNRRRESELADSGSGI